MRSSEAGRATAGRVTAGRVNGPCPITGRASGVNTVVLLMLLLLPGCSASSKGTRPPADGNRHGSRVDQSRSQPGDPVVGIPPEAVELLNKSMTDSCSVCVRDLRRRAFRLLGERYPPGVIVTSDSLSWFIRAPSGENEMILAPHRPGDPMLTFRFHTTDDHLVGISESDLTEKSLADRYRSAAAGTRFQGALEVVAFAYGDGPTFLYHASNNRVEVHCRILAIAEE